MGKRFLVGAALVTLLAGCQGSGGGGTTPGGQFFQLASPTPTPGPPNPGVKTGLVSRYAFTVDSVGGRVVSFRLDNTTGGLVPAYAASIGSGQVSASQMAVTGSFLYVPNGLDGSVSGFSIQPDGRMNPVDVAFGVGTPQGVSLVDVKATPDGRFAFGVDEDGTVYPLAIDPATGALQPNGAPLATGLGQVPLNGASHLRSSAPLLIHPSGHFLYVAGGNQVAVFSIDSQGHLTAGAPANVSTPVSMVTDPSGQFLYVSSFTGGSLSQFTINSGTGGLSPIGGGTVTAGTMPLGIAMEPGGHFLYSGSVGEGSIRQYHLGSGGALSLVGNPLTVGVGGQPTQSLEVGQLAVDATGRRLYVTTAASAFVAVISDVQQFNIAGDGTLSATTTFFDVPDSNTGLALSNGTSAAVTVPQSAYVLNGGQVSAFGIGSGGNLSLLNSMPDTSLATDGAIPQAEALATLPNGNRVLYSAGQNTLLAMAVNDDGSVAAPIVLGAAAAQPLSMLVDRTQQFLLVLDQLDGSVNVDLFGINADGSIDSIDSVPTGLNIGHRLAIDDTGSQVYATGVVTGEGGAIVPLFFFHGGFLSPQPPAILAGRSSADGVVTNPILPLVVTADPDNAQLLTFVNLTVSLEGTGHTATGANPFRLATDPLGRFVWAAIDGTVPHVANFVVDIPNVTVDTNGIATTDAHPMALSTDPTGQFLYVANAPTEGTGTVSQFKVNTDGTLSPLNPASVTGLQAPVDIVTSGVTQ
ncbi:MAG TPA: beta-propeller fold lactonase family protein [Candidatus Xenobia bacterium]|jgi:6-phosphogluconolactonase (cycloisomerase 2 family)